jgi:hypothetical protein
MGRAKPLKTVAQKWNQSILDTSYTYELIEAQFQTLFMLLGEEIRHNHAGVYLMYRIECMGKSGLYCKLLAEVLADENTLSTTRTTLRPAQAQAAYSLLLLHSSCVTQGQNRKKICVRVDFTLIIYRYCSSHASLSLSFVSHPPLPITKA